MNPWMWNPLFWNNQYIRANFKMNPMPPTIQDLMESMVNYENPEPVKIKNLAKAVHGEIFDFDYPLSNKVNKNDFEVQILNHFLLRRIGFETFTAFQIYLENKLNEIMPYYNILFDSLYNFNLFNDGEKITRTQFENQQQGSNSTTNTTGHNESDRRYNEFPQSRLDDLKNGSYVTSQNYDKNDITNNATNNTNVNSNRNLTEETNRSPVDKMYLYEEYLKTEKMKIMTLIYKDLESLFYQLN